VDANERVHPGPALRAAPTWQPSAVQDGVEGEASLRDVLRVLRRRKWIVLQAAILVPLIAALITLRQQPQYQAVASVLLAGTGSASAEGAVLPDRRAQTEADLARMPSVAAATLGSVPNSGLTADEFLDRSSVTSRTNSDILDFRVTDPSPERARALTTAYARSFIDARRTTRAGGSGAAQPRSALLVREAGTAERTQPQPLRMIVLGVVLGLILGVAAAFLWNALDTNVRDVREVGELLGLPLLGSVREGARRSRGSGVVMLDDPHGPEAEAFRILRANLEFANIDRSARVVMVTGAVDGEGRSLTAANLAIAIALAGRRVVLADLDLRHPSLHKLFALEGRAGLTDVALGHVAIEDAVAPIAVSSPDPVSPVNGASRSVGALVVLPSGPTPIDSGEFVGTQAVAQLIGKLREQADLVVLDAPPLLPVGDARTLSTVADALLVVTNLELVRRPMLQELARVLASLPTRVLGFVATGVTAGRHDAYGGYYRRHFKPRRRAWERAA
jgi:polysaccharide biosynthesis transport protein